jgi:hypothetical protein
MHRRTGESGFPRAPFPGSFRLMRERPGRDAASALRISRAAYF